MRALLEAARAASRLTLGEPPARLGDEEGRGRKAAVVRTHGNDVIALGNARAKNILHPSLCNALIREGIIGDDGAD